MLLIVTAVLSNAILLALTLFLLRKLKREREKAVNRELAIQEAKLKAIEEVVIGLAHAIRNPLGIVLQGIGSLERRMPAEGDIASVLNVVKNNVVRSGNVLNTLLDFSATSELDAEPPNVDFLIENALSKVKDSSKFENIEVIKEIQEGLPRVLVNGKKTKEAIGSLLLNAVQAMPEGGKLLIRSYASHLATLGNKVGRRADDYYKLGEKVVVIEIEDTGSGISMQNMSRLFEPFFTDKPPREGLGLGLWTAKNIIESQRGLIDIESREKEGTKVTVRLRMAGARL